MASSTLRPSTPPPPSTDLRTPSTPKHGWEDGYQPYSPRKSARVSSQRARAAYTPSRNSHANPHPSSKKIDFAGTPERSGFSPLSSRMEPTKKASSTTNGGFALNGLTYDSTASAAAALDVPILPNGSKMDPPTTIVQNNGMLFTPRKTPTYNVTTVVPGIKSIARNLFPIRAETVEEAMPTPKRNARKKYTNFSMGSFENEEEDTSVEIYTDSQDRVPEVDLSADNPFYGQSGAPDPESAKHSIKRRKIAIPGEPDQTIEEAERRTDGMIYVFRGKKVFRKFKDDEKAEHDAEGSPDAGVDAALAEDLPPRLRGPLTRSSIKPRLLFPTPEQIKAKEMRSLTEDEEEAATDVDEVNNMSTPKDEMDGVVSTPQAPKFAPVSPPTTTRASRSQQMDLDDMGRDGNGSPFRNRSYGNGSPLTRSRKREGEALQRRGRGKKVRGE